MIKRVQTSVEHGKKPTVPMDAALRYLTSSARTVREVERRLDELQYGEAEIMAVIERLTELGYVDDADYCRDFIDSRLRAKPVSRKHLEEQLRAHEADPAAIALALASVDDTAEQKNADEIAKKYARQLAGLPEETYRQRLEKRLLSRGFSYDTARRAVEAANDGEET